MSENNKIIRRRSLDNSNQDTSEVKNDKLMTVREVAEILQCSPETIKSHIRELWPDLMKNGITTYLNESQITIILERLKTPTSSGSKSNLQIEIVGIETSQSRVLKLKILQEQMQEIYEAEINELKKENQELNKKIENDRSLVEFADQVSVSNNSVDIGKFAKAVQDNNISLGRNKLFEWLREQKILMQDNIPYQESMNKGWFEVVEKTFVTSSGVKTGFTTLITGKGQIAIVGMLKQRFDTKK